MFSICIYVRGFIIWFFNKKKKFYLYLYCLIVVYIMNIYDFERKLLLI